MAAPSLPLDTESFSLKAHCTCSGSGPEEIKRAGSVIALPAHAISIKNKHLLVVYSTPTRGFTAAVSVFRGTPPAKPLICKSVSNHPGALISDLWADPTGEEFSILCAIFSFVRSDIIETSLFSCSQITTLSFGYFHTASYAGK